MNRTAYIAGTTTELPAGQAAEKFNVIAQKLAGQGYNVVKPAAGNDNSRSWDDAMRNDIKRMLECDEVHMPPDWQDNRGAQLERDIALRLGMHVVYH